MKRIYGVYLLQEFDVVTKFLWKTVFVKKDSTKSHFKYVYADSAEEARKKYIQQYGIDYSTWQHDYLSTYSSTMDVINIKNSAFVCEVSPPSLDQLRETMSAEDFLEFCKDRLYPVELKVL